MKTDGNFGGNICINQLLGSMSIFGRTCGGRIFLKGGGESVIGKVRALDHFLLGSWGNWYLAGAGV